MPYPSLVQRGAQALGRIIPPPALEVSRFDLRLPDLPSQLDGFCIAQVSDLHIGEGVWGPERADEASQVLREAGPDVIVNTGDFLEETPPWERVAEVAYLFGAPAQDAHRNLAILGNHDYYAGPDAVEVLKSHLDDLGIEVLENRSVCVEHHGAGITFVGITDEVPGYEDAVNQLLRADRPRIALVHVPDLAERLPSGAADLILAGHTHGGQITVPLLEGFIVRAFCGSRYVEGMYVVNANRLYVNRGLGCVGLPLRVRAAPEITILRLLR